MRDIINKIKEICKKGSVENSRITYLKNAIKVGENDNGDILCTYVDHNLNDFYDVDNISLNIIYDEKDCDLYGKDYDFTTVIYKEENEFQPRFIEGMSDNCTSKGSIRMNPNSLQMILNELERSGDKWIQEQKEIRTRSLFYLRNAVQKGTPSLNEKCNPKDLTWDEKLDRSYVRGTIEFLSWRRPVEKNCDFKTRNEMIELGEVEYNKVVKKRNDFMKEIMAEMKNEKR